MNDRSQIVDANIKVLVQIGDLPAQAVAQKPISVGLETMSEDMFAAQMEILNLSRTLGPVLDQMGYAAAPKETNDE